jgi:hypothetical protein
VARKDPEADREYYRQYRIKNKLRISQRKKSEYKATREQVKTAARIARHGRGIDDEIAAMWQSQDGRCYLCREPLTTGKDLHVEHDHVCCPPQRSCTFCRRGLTCSRCNTILGLAHDDADLLCKIAGNFRPVLAATRDRIALKPVQEALL